MATPVTLLSEIAPSTVTSERVTVAGDQIILSPSKSIFNLLSVGPKDWVFVPRVSITPMLGSSESNETEYVVNEEEVRLS